LLNFFSADPKQPVDMRRVIEHIVDRSQTLAFKPDFGPASLCLYAAIEGQRVGIVSNNGPLDPAGSNKITHFVQACDQTGIPLVWLHNTTGFMVGRDAERAGMIKHGSKQIQALSNARVPQITIHCGASFGAGNYGMCGRAFGPRFVFSWPNARIAVMGPQQAAETMATVMLDAAARKGVAPDLPKINALKARITESFERQMSAFYTSGLLLDDGIIDPRDTRRVLALCLHLCAQAEHRQLRPIQYGVSRA
jgi:geranyl-CoA carboxylase beta subunit